jgi:hypothetical protein
MVNTAKSPALGPAAVGTPPGYERPFWRRAGPFGAKLSGSFSLDGFNFEWHLYQAAPSTGALRRNKV